MIRLLLALTLLTIVAVNIYVVLHHADLSTTTTINGVVHDVRSVVSSSSSSSMLLTRHLNNHESHDYPIERIPCAQVPLLLQDMIQQQEEHQQPWLVNELRRNISLTDPLCLKQHLDMFAHHFVSRLHIRQFNLHVPKTGGTSLCQLVRQNNMSTGLHLCRLRAYCPFWCMYCKTDRYMSCNDIRKSELQFIGNERWLDYDTTTTNLDDHSEDEPQFCHDYAYSITIREPVARALSNTNMWFEVCMANNEFEADEVTSRLNIVQSNYMVWSLVAGSNNNNNNNNNNNPRTFQTHPHHVPMAKRVLSRFDYILEISSKKSSSSNCLTDVLHYMGLAHTKVSHARKASSNYTPAYHKDNYQLLNQLDLNLYEFALQIIEADCAFYKLVQDSYKVPTLPPSPSLQVHRQEHKVKGGRRRRPPQPQELNLDAYYYYGNDNDNDDDDEGDSNDDDEGDSNDEDSNEEEDKEQ